MLELTKKMFLGANLQLNLKFLTINTGVQEQKDLFAEQIMEVILLLWLAWTNDHNTSNKKISIFIR